MWQKYALLSSPGFPFTMKKNRLEKIPKTWDTLFLWMNVSACLTFELQPRSTCSSTQTNFEQEKGKDVAGNIDDLARFNIDLQWNQLECSCAAVARCILCGRFSYRRVAGRILST